MSEDRRKFFWSGRYGQQLAGLGSTALRHVVIMVLAVVVILLGAAATREEQPMPAHDSSRQTTTASTKPANVSAPKGGSPAPQQSGTVAGVSTQAPSPAVPNTAACKLLTLDAVRRVLGADAAPDAAKSIEGAKTADLAESTCMYTRAAATATLLVHVALTSLGASENALQFGSGKPAGVRDVPGYGQAAYWDSSQNELNILDNNNWLVLSRSDGSEPSGLDGVLVVAKAMEKV